LQAGQRVLAFGTEPQAFWNELNFGTFGIDLVDNVEEVTEIAAKSIQWVDCDDITFTDECDHFPQGWAITTGPTGFFLEHPLNPINTVKLAIQVLV
jgi:hypothetical protein